MFTVIATLLAVVVATLILLAIVFIVGMRTKSRVVFLAVRWLARRFMNPRQMASAGTPGAYAAIVRHEGRRTGTRYETPVGAMAVEDGFVIALPYGTRPNWLQNVLAGGSADLVHEGQTFSVAGPRIVPIDSLDSHFSASEQRAHRIFGVDQALFIEKR